MINKTSEQNSIFLYQLKTFKYAFQGLKTFFRYDRKATIHLTAAILAVSTGFLLSITRSEWIFISFAIGFVFVCEIINTAIENLVDIVSPDFSVQAGRIKDLMAGAVLISSLTSLAIGLFVYLPYLYRYAAKL